MKDGDDEVASFLDFAVEGDCDQPAFRVEEAKNRDCVLGQWTFESECSNNCDVGVTTRKRYIVLQAEGNGKPCPPSNCGTMTNCIEEKFPCVGKDAFGASACEPQCTLSAGSIYCPCASSSEFACNDGLSCEDGVCLSPSAPPLGCENCECRCVLLLSFLIVRF